MSWNGCETSISLPLFVAESGSQVKSLTPHLCRVQKSRIFQRIEHQHGTFKGRILRLPDVGLFDAGGFQDVWDVRVSVPFEVVVLRDQVWLDDLGADVAVMS